MISQFVEQVQILMEIQQLKLAEAENWNVKSKYNWLCSKKITLVILSIGHEKNIRQALTKVSVDEQIEILKKLMRWLNDHPETDVIKIPEITLNFINNIVMAKVIREANISRMNSFRNSLRRLSILSNRSRTPPIRLDKTRTVTFKDTPIIYKISE